MAAAARRRAESHFHPGRLAEQVEAFYAESLQSVRGARGSKREAAGSRER
jgi:hypothetical protein